MTSPITPQTAAAEFARTGKLVRLTEEQFDEFCENETQAEELRGLGPDGQPRRIFIGTHDYLAIPRKTFAAYMGVAESTVARWVERGMPLLLDGYVPVRNAVVWHEVDQDRVRKGRTWGRMDGGWGVVGLDPETVLRPSQSD